MTKRPASGILLATLFLALVGCGGSGDNAELFTSTSTTTPDAVATTAVVVTTTTPTSGPSTTAAVTTTTVDPDAPPVV